MNSIRKIMMLNYIAIVVIPLVMILTFTSVFIRKNTLDQVNKNTYLTSKSIATAVGEYMGDPISILLLIRNYMIETESLTLDQSIKERHVKRYIKIIDNTYELFDNIYILDQGGKIQMAVPEQPEFIGLDFSRHIVNLEEKQESVYFSKTYLSPRTKEPTINMVVYSENHYIFAEFNLEKLNDFIVQLFNGDVYDYIGVVDSDGNFIAHSDRNFVEQRYNISNSKAVQNAFLEKEGTYKNNENLYKSVSLIKNYGWVVIIGQQEAKILQAINRTTYILVFMLGTMFVFLTLISLFIAQKIINPIQEFKKEIDKVRKGKYTLEIKKNSFKEINQMAEHFVEMAETVQHREMELNKAKEAAEIANIAKGQFLAKISHELRTPMNAMIGFLDLTLNTNLDEKQYHYIQNSRASSKYLLKIINDLLDFTQLGENKLILERKIFKLEDVFKSIVANFAEKASKKGIEVLYKIDPDIPLQLIADPQRLEHALENILNNAIKFTKKGKVSIQGTLLEKIENTCKLQIIVQDTGIGMTEEEIKNLFSPFSQGDNKLTRKYEGIGLGLMITKNILKNMGGDIQVESQLGIGSTFTIFLTLEYSMEKITKEIFTEEQIVEKSQLKEQTIQENVINSNQVSNKNVEEIREILNKLEQLLIENSFEIIDYFADKKQNLSLFILSEDLQSLEKYISEFEFEMAQRLINEIIEKLK